MSQKFEIPIGVRWASVVPPKCTPFLVREMRASVYLRVEIWRPR
jgi:hypothetical protein